MEKGQVIGYKRVSTAEQHTDKQLEGIACDMVFEETISGKNAERAQLQAMIAYARKGDKIVVAALDRFARNLIDLRDLVDKLLEKGVSIEFIKENLRFAPNDNSPVNLLMLNVLGSIAEFERTIMLERQRVGIRLAKEKGVYARCKGREECLTPAQVAEIKTKIDLGVPVNRLARQYSVSRTSIYKFLRKAAAQSVPAQH